MDLNCTGIQEIDPYITYFYSCIDSNRLSGVRDRAMHCCTPPPLKATRDERDDGDALQLVNQARVEGRRRPLSILLLDVRHVLSDRERSGRTESARRERSGRRPRTRVATLLPRGSAVPSRQPSTVLLTAAPPPRIAPAATTRPPATCMACVHRRTPVRTVERVPDDDESIRLHSAQVAIGVVCVWRLEVHLSSTL